MCWGVREGDPSRCGNRCRKVSWGVGGDVGRSAWFGTPHPNTLPYTSPTPQRTLPHSPHTLSHTPTSFLTFSHTTTHFPTPAPTFPYLLPHHNTLSYSSLSSPYLSPTPQHTSSYTIPHFSLPPPTPQHTSSHPPHSPHNRVG